VVAIAQNEARVDLAISKHLTKNPFFYKYEMAVPNCGDWEKCALVLDKQDELRELLKAW